MPENHRLPGAWLENQASRGLIELDPDLLRSDVFFVKMKRGSCTLMRVTYTSIDDYLSALRFARRANAKVSSRREADFSCSPYEDVVLYSYRYYVDFSF